MKGDAWIEFHHQHKEVTPDQHALLSKAIEVSSRKVERKLIEEIIYLMGDTVVIDHC